MKKIIYLLFLTLVVIFQTACNSGHGNVVAKVDNHKIYTWEIDPLVQTGLRQFQAKKQQITPEIDITSLELATA